MSAVGGVRVPSAWVLVLVRLPLTAYPHEGINRCERAWKTCSSSIHAAPIAGMFSLF